MISLKNDRVAHQVFGPRAFCFLALSRRKNRYIRVVCFSASLNCGLGGGVACFALQLEY